MIKRSEPIIISEELSFGYDKSAVLSGVSFCIAKGDFVGVIGSNGTGKSTLIKLLLGLLSPTSGKIRFFESENAQDCLQNGKIGYVSQTAVGQTAGFPATVREIVGMGLFPRVGFLRFPKKKHHKMVMDALKLVRMEDLADRMIGSLSGGQQQRVMIAKALVNRPKLLILDEPTTGIDTESSEYLYRLLTKLNCDDGITVVMVTHDTTKIKQCANRILLLRENGIRELKRAEDPLVDF